jgi:hypothetical protein
MDKNEEIICDDCGQTFQSSIEVQSPIKHCPKCVEKSQEEMLRIMFGLDSKTNEENMSYSTVCEPIDLYTLIDTQLDKVVTLIQEAYEDTSYRHNGNWVELSEEDGKDLDGLTVIHVDPAFIAVYDEAEGSGEAIRMVVLKEYELRAIDD